jgi:hypothetical protein
LLRLAQGIGVLLVLLGMLKNQLMTPVAFVDQP